MKYKIVEIPTDWPKLPKEKLILKGMDLKTGVNLLLGAAEERAGLWAPYVMFLLVGGASKHDRTFMLDECFSVYELPKNVALPFVAVHDPTDIEKCLVQILIDEMQVLELRHRNGISDPYEHIEVGLQTLDEWFTGRISLRTAHNKNEYEKFVEFID
jgi:hypothetical protein